MNYYATTFEQMNTRDIQLWLHQAQWELPNSKGSVRAILIEGIRASAAELLYRYRQSNT